MNESARYVKIVEWSDEDHCFVGQCPGIIGPCCHGTDETQVYEELCQIVDEWIDIWKTFTAADSGKGSGKEIVGGGLTQT